ncbi:hypothetical protein [Streptomyces sp. NBC_01506]|uniref:hypothetical protein n=1 Tax=Streptomyces sp. NBC_01506 TaxID=2903887 RepID=UPI003866F4BE
MNSDWQSVRLIGEPDLPADPHPVPGTAELLLRGDSDVIDALERRLRADSAGLGVLLDPARPGHPDGDTAHRLSAIGAKLAASVPGVGQLARAEQTSTAAGHLRVLTGLLPGGQRGPFLFQCWQYWSRPFTPAVRTELGAAADRIAAGDPVTGDAARTAWSTYAQALRTLMERNTAEGCPVRPFEWFEHARRVHRILGVTPEAQACAALALRRAQVSP